MVTRRFAGQGGTVQISICRPGIVRVALASDGHPATLSYVESRDWPDTPTTVVEGEPLRVPGTLRDKRIPCDALIFLSSYGEALGWKRGVRHQEFQRQLWSKLQA